MKLIKGWKQSWKLATMWVAVGIMILSIVDILLRQYGEQVPFWIFYVTGPGVAVARVVKQFFDDEVDHGSDEQE